MIIHRVFLKKKLVTTLIILVSVVILFGLIFINRNLDAGNSYGTVLHETEYVNKVIGESSGVLPKSENSSVTSARDGSAESAKNRSFRETHGLDNAADPLYFSTILRGYGYPVYSDVYNQEFNVKFLRELARTGDFSAQRRLDNIVNPSTFKAYSSPSSQYNGLVENDGGFAKEYVQMNSDVSSMDEETREQVYRENLLIAAAYGKTDLISNSNINISGFDRVESRLAGAYAAILDGDAYQRKAYTDNGVLFGWVDNKEEVDKIKKAGSDLYEKILSYRDELGISSDVIATEENSVEIANNTECPTDRTLVLSSKECIIH